MSASLASSAPPAGAAAPGHRRVFISYSHDSAAHRDQVLALSERLRQDGIDTLLDRYIEGSPVQGWPRWMLDQLDAADSVLVVCTETYYRRFRGHEVPGVGKGVDWEGALITQEIYDSRNRTLKFVPVFLSDPDTRCIPEPLRAVSHYPLGTAEGYQSLYNFLLGQSAALPGPLGTPLPQARPRADALVFAPPAPAGPGTGPPGASKGLRAAALAALVLVGAGLAWWQSRPAPAVPGALVAGPGTPGRAPVEAPGSLLRLNVEVRFEPHALMKDFGPPTGLELILDQPALAGPFAFKADPQARFQQLGFALPGPGRVVGGTLLRVMQSAHNVTPDNVKALSTHFCLRQTAAAPPADGVLRLQCSEAEACRPTEAAGILVPCGARVGQARWNGPAWLPSAMAQPANVPAPGASRPTGPAPGDWLVPRLPTLQSQRGTPQAVAYSEVTLRFGPLTGIEQADAASHEVSINGRRLWVNGMPAWTHAVALVPGQPLTLAFGLENLDAAGHSAGQEDLEVALVLLRNKREVARDTVRLPFTALRDLPERVAQSAAGRTVHWSARYRPASADRYQIFVHGGGRADTLGARAKFDAARLPDPATGGRGLVGVVRPPLDGKVAWGVAVGALQSNGQVRFSFAGAQAAALCQGLQQNAAAQALRRQGFQDPARFDVREIAFETDDDKPKPVVRCSSFSAR